MNPCSSIREDGEDERVEIHEGLSRNAEEERAVGEEEGNDSQTTTTTKRDEGPMKEPG